MSLTQGSGPRGGSPGHCNYTIDSPAHKLLLQPDPRRLRAFAGDMLVLDTVGAHLLHETGIRPLAYIPLTDIDRDLLERSETTSHCPFKGDATYWSLRSGDELRRDAIWAYEEPLPEAEWLRGLAAPFFGRLDRWLVEDAGRGRAAARPLPPRRRARELAPRHGDGRQRGRRAVGAPDARLRDRHARARVPAARRCQARSPAPERHDHDRPYVGAARWWHVHAGGETLPDVAHGYELPRAEAMKVAGLVCLSGDGVSVEFDLRRSA